MKLWERAIELEKDGKGYNLKCKLIKEAISLCRCPGMYGLPDYQDDKYDNCQDFSCDNDYVPCSVCWDREFNI